MEAKIGNAREWLKLFFIFDNGVLKYGSSPMTPDSDLLRIPMDNVVSLRADVSNVLSLHTLLINIMKWCHQYIMNFSNIT